jgi:hypothetical protein
MSSIGIEPGPNELPVADPAFENRTMGLLSFFDFHPDLLPDGTAVSTSDRDYRILRMKLSRKSVGEYLWVVCRQAAQGDDLKLGLFSQDGATTLPLMVTHHF